MGMPLDIGCNDTAQASQVDHPDLTLIRELLKSMIENIPVIHIPYEPDCEFSAYQRLLSVFQSRDSGFLFRELINC